MTERAVFINAGIPEGKQDQHGELHQAIPLLMSLPGDDPSMGWRVIATYPSQKAGDTGYRSAHARAQNIRDGKVDYFTQWGQWDARARRMGDGLVGLYVRYLGRDGERWAGE